VLPWLFAVHVLVPELDLETYEWPSQLKREAEPIFNYFDGDPKKHLIAAALQTTSI